MGACVQKAAKAYWDFCPGEFHKVFMCSGSQGQGARAYHKGQACDLRARRRADSFLFLNPLHVHVT